MEYTFRAKFAIIGGDWYDPLLSDLKGSSFTEKARAYETKIDTLYRNSAMNDVYLNSEIITFERSERDQLIIFFNVYCWAKKTANDAKELENILRQDLRPHPQSAEFGSQILDSNSLYFADIRVDATSIEVKGRCYSFIHSLHGLLRQRSKRRHYPVFLFADNYPSAARTTAESDDALNANQTDHDQDQDQVEDHDQQKKSDVHDSAPFMPNATAADQVEGGNHNSANSIVPIVSRPPPPPSPATTAPTATCVPVSLNFCRHLSYNYTTSSNLLGSRGSRDGDRLYEAAKFVRSSFVSELKFANKLFLEFECNGADCW